MSNVGRWKNPPICLGRIDALTIWAINKPRNVGSGTAFEYWMYKYMIFGKISPYLAVSLRVHYHFIIQSSIMYFDHSFSLLSLPCFLLCIQYTGQVAGQSPPYPLPSSQMSSGDVGTRAIASTGLGTASSIRLGTGVSVSTASVSSESGPNALPTASQSTSATFRTSVIMPSVLSTASQSPFTTSGPSAVTPIPLLTDSAQSSSQAVAFAGVLGSFVQSGRGWGSDITKPEVRTRAFNDVENIKDSTESVIKKLGGKVPPETNTCSSGGKRKRSFDLLGAVKSVAKDALGLANCVKNVVDDISNEIGPLTGPPPGGDITAKLNNQLDALKQASDEEKDDDDDDNKTSSASDKSSTATSSSTQSSTVSSSASSSSSAASACPTYTYPDDDVIDEFEGVPDSNAPQRRNVGDIGDGNHGAITRIEARANVISPTSAVSTPPTSTASAIPSNAINAINSCKFPGSMLAAQPRFLAVSSFKNLGKQKTQHNGLTGQVFDAVPKWYVLFG